MPTPRIGLRVGTMPHVNFATREDWTRDRSGRWTLRTTFSDPDQAWLMTLFCAYRFDRHFVVRERRHDWAVVCTGSLFGEGPDDE